METRSKKTPPLGPGPLVILGIVLVTVHFFFKYGIGAILLGPVIFSGRYPLAELVFYPLYIVHAIRYLALILAIILFAMAISRAVSRLKAGEEFEVEETHREIRYTGKEWDFDKDGSWKREVEDAIRRWPGNQPGYVEPATVDDEEVPTQMKTTKKSRKVPEGDPQEWYSTENGKRIRYRRYPGGETLRDIVHTWVGFAPKESDTDT